jgi:hypothetical protein
LIVCDHDDDDHDEDDDDDHNGDDDDEHNKKRHAPKKNITKNEILETITHSDTHTQTTNSQITTKNEPDDNPMVSNREIDCRVSRTMRLMAAAAAVEAPADAVAER